MTPRARTTLAACLLAAAVLALHTGAALFSTAAFIVGVMCVGAAVALLFRTPEDPMPCVHGGATRCWPCQTDSCYETPTLHMWWDRDDVEHAASTGQAAPTGWCGCAWCGEPAVLRAGTEAGP